MQLERLAGKQSPITAPRMKTSVKHLNRLQALLLPRRQIQSATASNAAGQWSQAQSQPTPQSYADDMQYQPARGPAQEFRQQPYPSARSGYSQQTYQGQQTGYASAQPNQGYAQAQQYAPQQQGYHPQQTSNVPINPFLGQDAMTEGQMPDQASQQGYYMADQQYTPQTGFDPSAQIQPPQMVAWRKDHLNSLKVIGVVGQQPVIRYTQTGKVKANLRLAVETPGQVSADSQKRTAWMDVELWDKEALQVERYVQKGMKLAVGGYLKQDTWINQQTQKENSKLLVKANYFQLIEPYGQAQQGTPPAGFGTPGFTQNYTPPLPQGAGPGAPLPPKQPAGASANDLSIYDAWRQSPGVNFIHAAPQLNKTPEAVLDSISKAILSDNAEMTEADALRLASQLEIGPRDGPFLDLETINHVMDDALAEDLSKNPGSTLNGLRLKPMLERLQAMSSPRENGLPSVKDIIDARNLAFGKLGVSLSYAQLKFAKALRRKGIDLTVLDQPENIRASYQASANQYASSGQ